MCEETRKKATRFGRKKGVEWESWDLFYTKEENKNPPRERWRCQPFIEPLPLSRTSAPPCFRISGRMDGKQASALHHKPAWADRCMPNTHRAGNLSNCHLWKLSATCPDIIYGRSCSSLEWAFASSYAISSRLVRMSRFSMIITSLPRIHGLWLTDMTKVFAVDIYW